MTPTTTNTDSAARNAAILAHAGITRAATVHANLTAPALVTHALRRGEGRLSADGALMVETGVHTGRSVADKFVVDEPETTAEIWWGSVNQKLSASHYATLRGRVQAFLQDRELFVQDLFAGADPKNRIRVRLVTTNAWQALFARNMFIRPAEAELEGFEPDFVILHAPDFEADPAIDGVRSSTAIALSFAERRIVIAGTQYAGEIKKSIFTVMNWLLPARGVLPMHCSANIGRDDDVALFFGLSGTGKTTLSSDPARRLIGDDEHGWGPDGVFNFEGGCYAKVIDLSAEAEPEIHAASHRFGTVLENVVADARGAVNLADRSLTENTRSCYPIEFIPNVERSGRGGMPRNVVMLTADAFGVLPPIARLTPAQAMYHFLSGYTAKVAGTEKGLGKEPQATFSTCFGAPFLPRPPRVYGELLAKLIAEHGVSCWLVNTGWTGGAFGTGHRMSIRHTRALLNAALSGALDGTSFHPDRAFGLMIPDAVEGVPSSVLDPREAWADKAAYDRQAAELVARFEENFARFAETVDEDIRAAAIRTAA
ncbi:MAG TPA: phosphoenolpyruvate carboxykinase [Acidiphilium sp.]|uniref:phosphoenolpyruvate carboxykinase n=1 Tax=unclassified Acidiphilium TaxID=2617493 RepID=UPI000BCCCB17|nr:MULTISPECIES: phosphoenolpyruvate carboxykinase [unclassified Acidiphilium]OYV57688.1 MAG: phosphoenolpyruvate carboxykinase (ATP) [Acidiphilium sp. 20-67-58]HQT59986.1 phosphoenolpyruvate carboxykinase [Acidiphilium sp.]HQU10562.1 phosphoenolpyruvate carboxykinase [Acidiphilium sp.]